ncbi:hypothetical protein SAMN05446935_10487 [Burkholderia sp. YR290]|jgi:hypothetical protein|nr:hypothetical protein SAMN05446934_7931 [Paraburkholderia hospita]SOE91153.1 hypothetical protein SAMN05446935_10487 [Burkholderia sp. YR290]
MWKMLHLLNNTGRDGLTSKELFNAGVDCYSDTLMELATRGAVARSQRDASEFWTLNTGARAVLNSCTVAQKLDGVGEVQVDRACVFCIMPFSASVPWSDDVWKQCIEAAVTGAGLKPERGDTTLRTGKLIQNVWNGILKSGCVIADLSAPNPNVYYELGMAHALGRDAFVMVQKGVDLPADLRGAHYFEYKLGELPAATSDLRAKLIAWKDDPDIKVTGVEALFP